jgi:DNA-directed RNA polymerase specialized sigma24 family protein
MKRDISPTQQEFDALLAWLAPDRDEAGVEYEKIRSGLIRFFRFRGCDAADLLADETINRVAKKLSGFKFHDDIKTITYFLSFAAKIVHEEKRRLSAETVADAAQTERFDYAPGESENPRLECFERCLANMSGEKRKLLLEYFSKEKSEKLELRKRIAEALNIKTETLHTRVHRIKNELGDCVKKCMQKKNL